MVLPASMLDREAIKKKSKSVNNQNCHNITETNITTKSKFRKQSACTNAVELNINAICIRNYHLIVQI